MLPRLTAGRRLKAQIELKLAAANPRIEGLNHGHAQSGQRQLRFTSNAELRQIAAFRRHVFNHEFSVGTQHQIGFLAGLASVAGGRCHHRSPRDQHLTREHSHLIRHLSMNGPASVGDQRVQAAIGVTEDSRRIGVIAGRGLAQTLLSTRQPVTSTQHSHLTEIRSNGRQQRWHLTGQATVAQTTGQLQDGALVTHNLTQAGGNSTIHAEHRTFAFTHRWQLGRITHEHQSCFERVSTLQGNGQQRAVDHRGLVDQHQAEMLQRCGRLFSGFAQLPITLSLELQTQQAMNGGGVPSGLKTFETESLT